MWTFLIFKLYIYKMITKFKYFLKEDLKEKLEAKVGDYVIIHIDLTRTNNKDLIHFINNNIGQITSIRKYRDYVLNKGDICVKYFNVPEHLEKSFRSKKTKNGTTYYGYFSITDIVVFDKDKEYLDIKLDVKNFNL